MLLGSSHGNLNQASHLGASGLGFWQGRGVPTSQVHPVWPQDCRHHEMCRQRKGKRSVFSIPCSFALGLLGKDDGVTPCFSLVKLTVVVVRTVILAACRKLHPVPCGLAKRGRASSSTRPVLFNLERDQTESKAREWVSLCRKPRNFLTMTTSHRQNSCSPFSCAGCRGAAF